MLTRVDRSRSLAGGARQIATPLPNMANVASSSDARGTVEVPREQMQSLIERLERSLERDIEDVGSIGAAHRVERYGIAGYGRASALAKQPGEHDIANLLQETLDEGGTADKKLTQIVIALGLLLGSLNSPPSK